MRKQIYLMVAVLLVSMLFVFAASGDTSIDPAVKSVTGPFDLVVKGDLKTGSVATIDSAFTFDKDKLEVVSINGPQGWTSDPKIDNVVGTASFKSYTFTAKTNGLSSGIQSLYTINFKLKSGASGDAVVTLTSATAKSGTTNALGGSLNGAKVTIGSAPPPPPKEDVKPSSSGTVGAEIDAALEANKEGSSKTKDKSSWSSKLVSQIANIFKSWFG